jgi:hypothetical protein
MSEISQGITVLAHQIVDLDRLAVGFDDLAVYDDAGGRRLLFGNLQLLAGIAVETVGIDRRDIAPEAVGDVLPLSLAHRGPGRPDR